MVKREAHLITYSKSLRASQTPWENKLWRELRGNRFNGLKFKRQVPIENYIVDFCCNTKKIIIELDGSQHQKSKTDRFRDDLLKSKGYVILRFWNNDLDSNFNGVLQTIYDAIK